MREEEMEEGDGKKRIPWEGSTLEDTKLKSSERRRREEDEEEEKMV